MTRVVVYVNRFPWDLVQKRKVQNGDVVKLLYNRWCMPLPPAASPM